MVAKSLVVVPYNHRVPVKLLNASNLKITISKGKIMAEFSVLSNDYAYVPLPEIPDIPTVQNIQIVPTNVFAENVDGMEIPMQNEILSCDKDPEEFSKQFNISNNLTENQMFELRHCLYQNKDLFVTPEIQI